jgi:hypothetical protein
VNTAINIINAVWPYIAAGAGISVVTQVLKRLVKLESSKVILVLFHTITVVGTLVAYLLSNQTLNLGELGLRMAGLSGIAQAVHPFVSAANDWLSKLKQALDLINQDAPKVETAINEAAAAASTPPPANF